MHPYRDPLHREPSFSGIFSRGFLLLLLLGAATLLLFRTLFLERGSLVADAEPRVVAARGELAADEAATIALFQAAAPSVVHVETVQRTLRTGFFGQRIEVAEGSGSGFVWDGDGHVVTNYHVVRRAEQASVRLWDGSSHRAVVVGQAPDFDLAVLRIDASPDKLRPIPLGASGDLRVGQKAFAIGNPFGLDQTLTTGVVSGLDRRILSVGGFPIEGVIQTDAAINPGNSGGPLLDSAGRLIGVNTAIQSPTGTFAGVGFAVPVDTVNRIVPRILAEGVPQRAALGIRLGPDGWAKRHDLEGAVVLDVLPGSPAERAGLLPIQPVSDGELLLGDVIVAIDGEPVRGQEDLLRLLHRYDPRDTVAVRVLRPARGGRRSLELEVELAPLAR